MQHSRHRIGVKQIMVPGGMMAGQAVFERALSELKERRMAPAVWARALAEADGDRHRAVSIYIGYRLGEIEGVSAQTGPQAASGYRGITAPPDSPGNVACITHPPLLRAGNPAAVVAMRPAFNAGDAGHPQAIPQITAAAGAQALPLIRHGNPSTPAVFPSANPDLRLVPESGGEEFPHGAPASAGARCRARLLDSIIIAALLIGILLIVHSTSGPGSAGGVTPPVNPGWVTVAALGAVTLAVDALIYAVFGNSLGKALYGVEISKRGCRLGGGRYALRNFTVFVTGFGCGLPLVNLAAIVWQYSRLREGRSALYDDFLDVQTACREDNLGKRRLGDTVLAVAAIALILLCAVARQY